MSYVSTLHFDQFDHAITDSGVYQSRDGMWFAFHFSPGGESRSIGYDTADEARADLWTKICQDDRWAWQKWQWMTNGDRSPEYRHGRPYPREFRNILRIGGIHYTLRYIDRKSPNEFRGFGGSILRWRWLDEPEGTVHWSDDVFTQGQISSKVVHLLPDNAVWVTETGEQTQ